MSFLLLFPQSSNTLSSSIGSRDVERQFTLNPRGSFSFTVGSTSYTLDFSCMGYFCHTWASFLQMCFKTAKSNWWYFTWQPWPKQMASQACAGMYAGVQNSRPRRGGKTVGILFLYVMHSVYWSVSWSLWTCMIISWCILSIYSTPVFPTASSSQLTDVGYKWEFMGDEGEWTEYQAHVSRASNNFG